MLVPRVALFALLLTAVLTAETPRPVAPTSIEPIADTQFWSNGFASDGTNILHVWLKDRSLLASIITPDGHPVSAQPVVVMPGGIHSGIFHADAVWNGREYLIVWSLPQGNASPQGLYALALTRDGRLPSLPRRILDGSFGSVTLAWNGNNYLLAANDTNGARSNAFLLDDAANIISRARLDDAVDIIEPLGATFLIGKTGFRSYVAILDARMKPRLLPVSSGPTFDMAANGDRAVGVTSFDSISIDIQSFDSTHANTPVNFITPAPVQELNVVATSGGYVVIFTVSRLNEMYALEIDAFGLPVGSAKKVTGPEVIDLFEAVATVSDVVVQYRKNSQPHLTAIGAESGSAFPLSKGRADQVLPALTSDGADNFVLWVEISSSGRRLVGSQVSLSGLALGQRVIFTTEPFWGYSTSFDGQDFLVAWSTDVGVYLQRVAPIRPRPGTQQGERPADTGPLLISLSKAYEIALAWNGFDTLLAWSPRNAGERLGQIQGALIRGRTVSPIGSISRPLDIEGGPFRSADHEPNLAWTGSHWVLTWRSSFIPESCFQGCIVAKTAEGAVRIAATGAVIDSTAIRVPGLAIASNGTDSLVVWDTSGGLHDAQGEIRGTRLDADGSLVDGMDGFLIAHDGHNPAVQSVNNSYVVAWSRMYPHTDSSGLVLAFVEGDKPNRPLATTPKEGMVVETPALGLSVRSKLFVATSEKQTEPPYSGSSLITGRVDSDLSDFGPAPQAPSEVVALSAGKDVVVTWIDASSNEDGYIVEIGGSTTSTWVSTWVPADSELAQLRVTAFDPSLPMWARVRAYNTTGRSEVVTVRVEPSRTRASKN